MSLGNILIILGMLASAATGISVLSVRAQALQDAVTRESDARSADVAQLHQQIAALGTQESRDVGALSMSIADLRTDVRGLVTSQHAWNSIPHGGP